MSRHSECHQGESAFSCPNTPDQSMLLERRGSKRFECERKVKLTVLHDEGASIEVQATMVNMSGSGMKVLAPIRITAGAAVKVELEDAMLLGEVVRVESNDGSKDADQTAYGIHFSQGIFHLAEVQRLMETVFQRNSGRDRREGIRGPS